MTSLRNGFWIVLAIASVLSLGAAFNPPEDGVLFRESFTVPARETYSGNIIAVESTVILEEGSRFEGNIILFNGSLDSAGTILGDVASVGASVHIAATSTIEGNVVCIGPVPRVDEGAKVSGTVNAVEGISLPFSLMVTDSAKTESAVEKIDFVYEITVVLFRLFLMAAVATLIVLFLPAPTDRVARTLIQKPAVSFLIGLLTMMAAVALFLLLALTVCLSPISVLGSVILLVAVLLGWSALGLEIGRQIFGIVRAKVHPAVMAGIGTAVLTLVASGFGYVPLAGPILILLVMSFTLGAVVLTRFGGTDYLNLPKGNPPDLKSL
jgi:hypothetical protein